MSETTLSELAGAEIVPNMGGENAWMIRVDEGDYRTVNKSGKNTLLIKGDVDVEDTYTYGGVTATFDLEADEISIERDDNEVRVPAEKHEAVLWSVYDEDGPRLNKLFEALHVPTVRQGLLDMLMPRFRQAESDIVKTGEGWLLNGDILVAWDATNSPVDVSETHIVQGNSTAPAATDKEAREIRFNLPDESTVALPNGTRTSLDDVEMKFLTSVALILVTQQTGLYDDGLSTAISQSRIVGFTDTRSGLYHGHDLRKHTLGDLGVTEDAQDRLWYNSHDHTGVHELYVRREEFENAPIDVFEDTVNTDARKWEKIQETSEMAPIPKHVRSDLYARYENE